MIHTKYGDFAQAEVQDYKTQLHKKIFWLLLYKDPKTASNYSYVNFDKYFDTLMTQLHGLRSMMKAPSGTLIELMSILQSAFNETLKDPFNYHRFRKFILDSHSMLDRLDFEED